MYVHYFVAKKREVRKLKFARVLSGLGVGRGMIVFLQETFLFILTFFQYVEVAGDFFILNCCNLIHADSQFIAYECCLSDVIQKFATMAT